ncbi:unnamed protein product [[Actinomadura] parvosata subsp. kistnae]|nr:unnamed protein product [Actinomadura parvosata subsp. kistnae]
MTNPADLPRVSREVTTISGEAPWTAGPFCTPPRSRRWRLSRCPLGPLDPGPV